MWLLWCCEYDRTGDPVFIGLFNSLVDAESAKRLVIRASPVLAVRITSIETVYISVKEIKG